ncbi:hypothetical protein HPB49_013590 [Dermacentor silvarum]|uniref:Uncharacterized protein n=1 Tax=Dermacentor silvarum TaxID=543639 RepID=A0ACB8E0J5_DERSI|nr:hypothetical protein HPB49_013590 [Dermacentor silvarum]
MAECDLIVVVGVKDRVSQCNSMQAPCTIQGVHHKMVVSSGTVRLLMIQSSEKQNSPGAEAAASMIRQVVKCGTAASPEYSLGVLAGNPLIHPRDTLTCVLMMLNCINPESNSHRHSVVTPRSCLWRLHAREDIVSVINRNCVVVISGETGSGKTTQAAEFIFQDYIREGQGARCNIVVTQPRRIAGISMAKRAALERHEEEGIHERGVLRFQKPIGAIVAKFFEISDIYWCSTVDRHNEQLFVEKNGVCVGSRIAPIAYAPSSMKNLLPYTSGYVRIVKPVNALGAINDAIYRSCHHEIKRGFNSQIPCLRASGHPEDLLCSDTLSEVLALPIDQNSQG